MAILEISKFRSKIDQTAVSEKSAVALEEIAVQLMRINARLDEVGTAIDNAASAMS
jgi:hypothetical protein